MNKLYIAMAALIEQHLNDVKSFLKGDDMSDNLYEALYDYYLSNGMMPYGTAKARDGDPMAWVADRFYNDASDYLEIREF